MAKNIIETLKQFYSNEHKLRLGRDEILVFLDSKSIDDFYEAGIKLIRKIGSDTQKEELVQNFLIENLLKFEENLKLLLPDHRDHFIHSIFVYLMGLYIFFSHKELKKEFLNQRRREENYWNTSHSVRDEEIDGEFLFRWQMVSLFHDLAYPLELSAKLMNTYAAQNITSYGGIPGKTDCNFFQFQVRDLENLFHIGGLSGFNPQSIPLGTTEQLKWIDAIDLISTRIGMDSDFAYRNPMNCNEFLSNRIKSYFISSLEDGYVDHGLFSAIIFLKWCIKLYREHRSEDKKNWQGQYFYTSIAECAKSIALHTMHRRLFAPVIKIDYRSSPLTYLLILCDEIQEWYRRSGKQDFTDPDAFVKHIEPFQFEFDSQRIRIRISDKDGGIKIKLDKLIHPNIVSALEENEQEAIGGGMRR